MKINIWIGLFACSVIGLAQENPSATATDTSPAGPPAAIQADVVLPLIQYEEVPLTTVIENLARQAGLNYILDYKVPYGQLGPDGKPLPQPNLTIRWENLTAEAALAAVLNNYDLQLVEDPKTKVARITRRDPAAPDPLVTRIIQLKYSSASNMVAAVQTIFVDKRSKVLPDTRTSQLVVSATEKELLWVDELVERLDTATKQVLIEARLMETILNPSSVKGIDWSGTLSAQNVTFGNGVMSGNTETRIPGAAQTTTLDGGRQVTTTPRSSENTILNTLLGQGAAGGVSLNTFKGFTPNIGFLNADGLRATLSFLNQYADTKVLSEPRTVTLDNETATLSVIRATPVINVTAGTANTTGGSQITYTNLGVILTVTPRISANNYVNLKIVPEVSRKFDTVTKNLGAQGIFQADEYDIRKIETHVMIPSGYTLVLGGLVADSLNTSGTKVPLLGDLPLLGPAFRSDSKSRQKQNLLIFITPTIVQESDFQVARSEFLKTPMKVDVEPEWSPYDSAKPVDWSKPHPLNPNAPQPTFDESLVAPQAQ